MKFNCGMTRAEAHREYAWTIAQWHDVFAFFPIRVGPEECRWLEVVQRRNVHWNAMNPVWEYRAREST